MRVHFIIHEAFEAPGAFIPWAEARGCDITFSQVYQGEPLPKDASGIDLLVIMGGPQSPETTREECPHFDSQAEQHLIHDCIDTGTAVVGVCLGAQLIGAALGGPVERSPEKEIGVFPITFTTEGRADPKFRHFGESKPVGHWHGDMPGLTKGARVLAFSAGCPRQIVEYAPLVYALQCHMELTPEVVDLLIEASGPELAESRNHRFVQQPDALRANDYAEMNGLLHQFLDGLMEDYRQSRRG
ncbi:MAG: type 1 glutamine amidotransferase [Pseudorhodobacter sp.]